MKNIKINSIFIQNIFLTLVLFSCIQSMHGSEKNKRILPKEELIRTIVSIVSNQQSGSIISECSPYFKFLMIQAPTTLTEPYGITKEHTYPGPAFRTPELDRNISIFDSTYSISVLHALKLPAPHEISQALAHIPFDANPQELISRAAIGDIVHCLTTGYITSNPAIKRSIVIINPDYTSTTIE